MKLNIAMAMVLLAAISPTATGQTTSAWSDSLYSHFDYKTFADYPPANERINMDSIDFPLLHAAVLYETNRQRALADLPTLKHDSHLEDAARTHSRDMVEHDFFSHDSRLEGKETVKARLSRVGLENVAGGENIALESGIEYESGRSVYTPDQNNGYFSYEYKGKAILNHTYLGFARQVVGRLMNSNGHRENILNPIFVYMGAGAAHCIDTTFHNMDEFKVTQVFTSGLGELEQSSPVADSAKSENSIGVD